MESPLLPSEIARLVLGYLEEEKCDEAAQCFLEHSPHLSECLAVARQGRRFSTRVLGNSLNDILDEYCAVNSLVAEHLRKLPEDSAEQLRQCGRLIDQLRFLLDSTRSGQTVLVSITVPPQGSSPPGSNVSSIVSNRSRSWLQSSSERKRTSVRWHHDTKQRSRDRDDRGSSAGSIPPLEATPLESLPGISGGSSGLDSRSTQTGRDGESQASSAAKVLEETTVSSSGPEPEPAGECVAERQANTSDSDQSYKAPRVSSKDRDPPSPTVPSPRRKSHSAKKKPSTPLLKGQSPNRPRRSHSEDSESSENVAKSLHRALLDNKELHEKIAENINRVIRIPNEGGTEAQGLGLQASEPLADCDSMMHELNQAIKTIVEQTEQDPLFERFLDEIIGPVEDEGSPSPPAAESETEDASGLSETVADEDVQSKTQEEEDEQSVKSPSSDVPLKQRLRSSSKQKRDSLNTSGSSPLSAKESKKPVCSLDDQNALAIQYIVDALPHHSQDGIRHSSPHRNRSTSLPHHTPDGARQPSPHRNRSTPLPHHTLDGSRQPSPHRSKRSATPQAVNSSTENTSTNSSRNSSDVIREKRASSQCVSTTSEPNAQTASKESDSCASDKRTDDLSLGKPFSLDAAAAKKPVDNPPATLISTEMPIVLPVQSSEPKSSMPIVMVTIPSSQELCSVSTSLEASHHRQHLTEQDIMSMPTVIVCDPDRGMGPLFNLSQQSICTTAEVTHIQSYDDITSRYKPIAPKTTTSTNTSTVMTSLPTDIVQPIVLRSVSHKQLETILTTTCTTPVIVKRDITPRIKTVVDEPSPLNARRVVEVQTKSLPAHSSKKVVDLSKPSTSKEGFGAEQYKRTLKQQTGGESRKKKEDAKKDEALSGVRTRSQDKALNKQPVETPAGPDSITLYACDADGKNDKMSTLKRQDVDLPDVCTDGSPAQLSKSPAAGHEGTPSEDGREKLLGALNLKHSGRKSSENPDGKSSKVVSPQLKTLLSMSKNNAEKAAGFEDVAVGKARDTPQTLSGRSVAIPKRLSLSTPRRRRSHIRALDFGTPPKSGTEGSALRRSNTSPKGVACKQRSPRGNDSSCKSVRRSSCYKSPLSRINQAKNIRSSLFKSPNPPCGSDLQDAAVVTSSRAECPIATRSPAPQLKGDWDKVTGAGLIFGSETPEHFTSEPAPAKQLVPKTLLFSPESQPSDSETQQTAASIIADKGDSTDSASVTSTSQTSIKSKSKSRTWDADLRALLTRDFDNLEVVPKPTKMKARKRCSSNLETKVPAKKNKKSRISRATKDEARMVEAMLNSSGETEKGQDNSDVTSPAEDISHVSRAEAKDPVTESSSQKDESESTVSNVESTSDPSGKTSIVEDVAPSHEPPVEEPSPDSSSVCESNVAVTSSEKMFNNSAACAKVVLSPTKLNASKRTFVQKPKGCGLYVSEDFEENIETFVISGDSPADNSKPNNETGSADIKVPENRCAKSEVSLPPPPPKVVLLDTPRKIDAIAADLSRLIPLTPRLLSPRHNQEDTPMTKFLRDQPCINLSMIQTPSFPPTPHLAVTPNSQRSDESPSSYATRMTDYSSCSSYYNPSTYLNTPAKHLEQVLIDECHRIETGKPSSKEKRHGVGSSAEKLVIVDTSEIEKEMERIHGPIAETTCVEKGMEPACEADGHSIKTSLAEEGSNMELVHIERELGGTEESKRHEDETTRVEKDLEQIHEDKRHEDETTRVEKDLEQIHEDKRHEDETTRVEKDLEQIHEDKRHEDETTRVEKDLEQIHEDKRHEDETTPVEKELELVHEDKRHEDETTRVEKDLEQIHEDKRHEDETTPIEKELELVHEDKRHEDETTRVEKDLEQIHEDKRHEDETTRVEKELELIHEDKRHEDETTRVEKDLEQIHEDKRHEDETTRVEKDLEQIHEDKRHEDETPRVEKDLEQIHEDKRHEDETTRVEKDLEQIHEDKRHEDETTRVEKDLEQIHEDKRHEDETTRIAKELEPLNKDKGHAVETTRVEKDLEQIHKNEEREDETERVNKKLEQFRKRKRHATKTTNVENKKIHEDKAHAVKTVHMEGRSGRIRKYKGQEAKTTNVEKELEQIDKDKEPVPEITLVEKELERIHEGEVSCNERETEGETSVPCAELLEPRRRDDVSKSAETLVCSGMESRPVGKDLETQRLDSSEHQGDVESNTEPDAGSKASKSKISLHSEKVAVHSSDTGLEQTKSGEDVLSVQKKCIKDVAKRPKPCSNKVLRTPLKSKNKIVKKTVASSVKKQELEKEIMQKSSEELIKNCLENAHKMLFGPSKEDWDGSDSSSDDSSSSSSSSSSTNSRDSSSSEDFSPVGAKKKAPKIIESDSLEEPLNRTPVEGTEVTSGTEQREKSGESAPQSSAGPVAKQSKIPTTLTVVVDLKKAGIREEVINSSRSSWEVMQEDKSPDSSVTAAGEVQNCAFASKVANTDSNAEEISSSLKNVKLSTQWNLCADDAGSSKSRVCRASFDKSLSSELEDKKQRMLARLKEADKKMKPVKSKGNCPPKTSSSVRKKSDDVGGDDNNSKKITPPNVPRARPGDIRNQTSAEGHSLLPAKSPKKDVEAIAARLLQEKNAASSQAIPRKENTAATTEKTVGQKEKSNEAGGQNNVEMCARDKVKLIHTASRIRPPMLKGCREKPTVKKGSASKLEPPPATAKVKKTKSSSILPQAKSSVNLLDSRTNCKQPVEEGNVSEEVRVEKLEEPMLGMSQGMFIVRYEGLGPRHPDFVVEDISSFVMDSEEADLPPLTVSSLQELLTVAPNEKKDKLKSPRKKTALPLKSMCFDTRPLSVRKQEMYRNLRNRHRNSLERKLGSPSSRSNIHCRQKTSLQHKSPLAHLYKDYISEKYTVTQRKHTRFSPARHKHVRSSREELIRSPRRFKTEALRCRASSRSREPSSSHRRRHETKRKVKTRHSRHGDSSPTNRSKKTSDHSRHKEGELSDTSDEKEHLKKKKAVSRVWNPNSATEPEQELTDDTLMTYAIVGSYREETTGESSSVGSPYHTPGQDFDITARVPPPSVSCMLNREASDTSAAASGPTTSDESRSLPPKKRKASTEDSTVQPEKRARTENPQSLLKSVDLDIFLTMVHGNELS